MSDWVSVDDRLPDSGEWYLVANSKYKHLEIVFFDGTNGAGIHWLQNGDYLERVTHWMPLPEPPEGE